ncbi:DNA repair protein RecO [Spirulina subsalsa FACHB-351]|uniref:DNA repair protein RecO n=1 Tax=Spirulina subsalsa FACHB-351 TaxID=234711 RepID=A0ABT3L065_9CYAN|nr:DNA repair protein RecO [Spirulina subsalsa]MCW6034876.1 DNA repair protein RecO [Spirulina subsalsa FACHB-351]
MSRTYKATGINLKSLALGECDRLVTILTAEYGLVQAVAPGARKPKSSLRGRIEPFVVNELLLVKGRSLDKIIQAETLESYPRLSQDLGKLATSQYWAEMVLAVGLSDQPQAELLELLKLHLQRLDQLPNHPPSHSSDFAAVSLLCSLTQGVFHLLTLAGLAPQVQGHLTPGERVGFSFEVGGVVPLSGPPHPASTYCVEYDLITPPPMNTFLGAQELTLLQHLAQIEPCNPHNLNALNKALWLKIEQTLRNYTQYHLGKPIRSAALVDTLFTVDF